MIKIMKYGEVSYDEIFARAVPAVNVEEIVSDIIADVRKRGDEALFDFVSGSEGWSGCLWL